MAKTKDKRSLRLLALRRKELRIMRRAQKRRSNTLRKIRYYERKKGLTREEQKRLKELRELARDQLRVVRRHREEAQQLLQDRRARRKALRYRLKMKPKNGLAYFEGKQVAAYMVPILRAARATGLWNGTVTSGYRSTALQWIIYYVKRIRPAARPGTSNHEKKVRPGGAIDTNDPWGLRRALQRVGRYGWGEGKLIGFQIPNDPWHFSPTGR